MTSQESYIYKVKDILETEGKITSWDAIRRMGNTRLSSTIHVLRHKYDMNINTEMKTAENGKTYGEYTLVKENTNDISKDK